MKLTPVQEQAFQEAEFCHICKQALDEKRTRDYDHISGVFRRAAHVACNLSYKQTKYSITRKIMMDII